MKKLNILLLSAIAMGSTLVSCTKDDKPSNLSMSGKWNFSMVTLTKAGQSDQTMEDPQGFLSQETQCDNAPDYIDFKNGTTVEYGDNDTHNTPDCTLTKTNITYSTTPTTMTFKSNNSQGSDLVFTVLKQTATELQLKMDESDHSYIFKLTKAAN